MNRDNPNLFLLIWFLLLLGILAGALLITLNA